jgi:hypothetical protein
VLEDQVRDCVVDAVTEENADPAREEMMTVPGKATGR